MRIEPGGTVGIVGGGQLARMLAMEARRMGYRVAVLDPDPSGPAAQVADLHIEGALDHLPSAEALAHQSDVITLDTEHVPSELLERLGRIRPVRPSGSVLGVVQDRLRQRRFLETHRIPQVAYASVPDAAGFPSAAERVGFPAVLKTRRSGYDGKGQARIGDPEAFPAAWHALGGSPSVLERFIDFEREISVLLARGLDGNVRFYPISENAHRGGILRTSRIPARIPSRIAGRAEQLGLLIANALEHVGMMAVELFVTRGGELLVNEIAPRTHNSGHYTFGACATSQFEQHVRAICGIPLGDPSLMRPAVMLNLLGDLWAEGSPPSWVPILSRPSARLHLYGKCSPKPGRKMGHVLILEQDIDEADRVAEAIAGDLTATGAIAGGEA